MDAEGGTDLATIEDVGGWADVLISWTDDGCSERMASC